MCHSNPSNLLDEPNSIAPQPTIAAGVTPRSWLFVPAMRPERFTKALKSGADAVILDLEDTVDGTDKEQAREHIAKFVTGRSEYANEEAKQPNLWIRINNDQQLDDDLALCLSMKDKGLTGVVLPKVTVASQVQKVYSSLQLPIVAQIESAEGIIRLDSIAKIKGLMALSYGRLDLANQLNLRSDSAAERDFFNQLRIKMLLASKAYGLIAPIESIYADFKNEQGMHAAASYASDLGFSGMLCIHPSQVSIAHQAFKASASQLAFATKVIDHYQQTAERIFAIDGVMVDLPLIRQCQRVLQQAN